MGSLKVELAQVIAALHMVSQVPAASLEPGSPSSEAKGGRKPAGGISHQDDRDTNAPLKSAEHFIKRMAGCRTDSDYTRVLEDARAALDRWKRTPPQAGTEPEYGTLHWKRWVAASKEPNAELARRFNVSPQYIGQVRKQYAPEPPTPRVK